MSVLEHYGDAACVDCYVRPGATLGIGDMQPAAVGIHCEHHALHAAAVIEEDAGVSVFADAELRADLALFVHELDPLGPQRFDVHAGMIPSGMDYRTNIPLTLSQLRVM